MINSGLSDLLRLAFGSVDKLLSGKIFPQNLRALRMVVQELLRGSIDDMTKFDGPTAFLQTLREHLHVVSYMIPYFLAAGCQNYAC